MALNAPTLTSTSTPGLLQRGLDAWALLTQALNALQPLVALAARVYVAQVFFLAGLTKLRDWDTTLLLFTEEYKVPLLSPAVAAVMGTAGEIVLPILLLLGLGGRFAALGLSLVNAMAVLALAEIAPAAFQQHILWGALLAGIAIYGPGPWSLERWVWPRLRGAAA
jgi:putative oxidoreductase